MMKFCGGEKGQIDQDQYCCIIKYQRVHKSTHKDPHHAIRNPTNQSKQQIFRQNNMNKSTTKQRVSLSKKACQNISQNKAVDSHNCQQYHNSKRLHLQSFNYLAKTSKAKLSQQNSHKKYTGFPQRIQYHTPHNHNAPNIEYFHDSQKNDAKLPTKQVIQRKLYYCENMSTSIKKNMTMQRETGESSTKQMNTSVDGAANKKGNIFQESGQARVITNKSLKLSSNYIKQSLAKLHGQSSNHSLLKKNSATEMNNLPIIRNLSEKLNTVISINDSKADSNNQFNLSNKNIPQRQPQQPVNRIDQSVIIMNFFHPQGQLKQQIDKQLGLRHQ